MNKKNLTLIAILLTFALSAAGFTYAMWSDQIIVHGEVHTDTLNLAWVTWEDYRVEDNEIEIKDYAWGTVDYLLPETDSITGLSGYEKLKLDVYNAYPGYYIRFTNLLLGNLGTTPLDLCDFDVIGYDPAGNEMEFSWLLQPYSSEAYGVFWEDINGNGVLDPETDDFPGEERFWLNMVSFPAAGPNNKGIQIHRGGKLKGEIDIYFLQPMKECTHYSFEIKIKACQWNWDPAIGAYNVDLPMPPI